VRPEPADERAARSVLRALALVEECLGRPVGVEDMARAAAYSPFHFSRLFTAATGHAPYDSLMRRRVAVAAEQVVGGSRSITDIALDCGFEGPDGLARAFRRCFGTSPSDARRAGAYPRSIARLPIAADMVELLLGPGAPPPERVEAGRRTVAGFFLETSARATAEIERLRQAGRGGTIIEVRTLAEDAHQPWLVGAEAAADAVPQFPGSVSELPAGVYVRFACSGHARIDLIAEYALRAWLPTHGFTRPPGFQVAEHGAGGALALCLPVELADGGARPG
jgi:AraC-like DNA-binding protein